MAFTADEIKDIEPERERICGTCRFYIEDEDWETDESVGECHEDSPKPYVAAMVNPDSPYKFEAAAAWPKVKGNDSKFWCGKWIIKGDQMGTIEGEGEE